MTDDGSGGTLQKDNRHVIGRPEIGTRLAISSTHIESEPLGSKGAALQAQKETGGIQRV